MLCHKPILAVVAYWFLMGGNFATSLQAFLEDFPQPKRRNEGTTGYTDRGHRQDSDYPQALADCDMLVYYVGPILLGAGSYLVQDRL